MANYRGSEPFVEPDRLFASTACSDATTCRMPGTVRTDRPWETSKTPRYSKSDNRNEDTACYLGICNSVGEGSGVHSCGLRMVKCREEGRVVNVALLLAVGVNNEGHREILDVAMGEAAVHSLAGSGGPGVGPVLDRQHMVEVDPLRRSPAER